MTNRRSATVVRALVLVILACDADAPRPDSTPAPPALEAGPIRRDTLSTAQLARTRVLRQTFADVDTSSLETWVDGFRRDLNPEQELAHWEAIAKAYREYTAVRNLVRGAKSDVFQVLVLRSSAPESWVLANMTLTTISSDEAKEVMKHYTAAPAPITVAPKRR